MMVTIPRSSVDGIGRDDSDSQSEDDRDNEEDYEENSDDDQEEGSDTSEVDSTDDSEDGLEAEDEAAAEKGELEIIDEDDGLPGPHQALEHNDVPIWSSMGNNNTPKALVIPILHRQDSQNPILEMRAKLPPKEVVHPKSVIIRRSSRLPREHVPYLDELLLDSIDNMAVSNPQNNTRSENLQKPASTKSNNGDDFWRPREPQTKNMPMEMEHDAIVDPPTPVLARRKSPNMRGTSGRPSRMDSQARELVPTRPPSPQRPAQSNNESQGSVVLGDTQILARVATRSSIPETQFLELNHQPGEGGVEGSQGNESQVVRPSQLFIIPESSDSSFGLASQGLRHQVATPSIVRRKSMPPSMHRLQTQESGGLMAGGITMTAAFHHTIGSTPPSIGRIKGTLLAVTPGTGKSLKSLTRQASIGLGTIPCSGRRRMQSLPFKPPFKDQQDE